jgi:hypothetical protein
MAGGFTAEREALQEQLDEEPELRFRQYAIAFHVAAAWCGEGEPERRGATQPARAMESYEEDMLLYAHRDDPPFRTLVVPAKEPVTVRFPPELEYEAEGRTRRVRCAGATKAGRLRNFRLAVGHTVFERSDLAALTLVLTPMDPPSEDSEINEYDVIKLVKLWEGG